jgi:hypothetical protein
VEIRLPPQAALQPVNHTDAGDIYDQDLEEQRQFAAQGVRMLPVIVTGHFMERLRQRGNKSAEELTQRMAADVLRLGLLAPTANLLIGPGRDGRTEALVDLQPLNVVALLAAIPDPNGNPTTWMAVTALRRYAVVTADVGSLTIPQGPERRPLDPVDEVDEADVITPGVLTPADELRAEVVRGHRRLRTIVVGTEPWYRKVLEPWLAPYNIDIVEIIDTVNAINIQERLKRHTHKLQKADLIICVFEQPALHRRAVLGLVNGKAVVAVPKCNRSQMRVALRQSAVYPQDPWGIEGEFLRSVFPEDTIPSLAEINDAIGMMTFVVLIGHWVRESAQEVSRVGHHLGDLLATVIELRPELGPEHEIFDAGIRVRESVVDVVPEVASEALPAVHQEPIMAQAPALPKSEQSAAVAPGDFAALKALLVKFCRESNCEFVKYDETTNKLTYAKRVVSLEEL